MNSNLDKLKAAFVEALNTNPNGDFQSLAYGQTAGWDSVAHMALVAAIENQFDIMLSTDEVIDLSSFPKAMEIVSRYDVSFA